jgi:hypothetical protein
VGVSWSRRRHPAEASAANLASMGQLKVLALKAVAARRSGGRQTKVEARSAAKRTQPSWRIQTSGIAPNRLRTNTPALKIPLNRQILIAIGW